MLAAAVLNPIKYHTKHIYYDIVQLKFLCWTFTVPHERNQVQAVRHYTTDKYLVDILIMMPFKIKHFAEYNITWGR